MSQTYTEAFTISTAGSSAGCMALHNPTGSSVTAVVVPWRFNGNGGAGGATCAVAVPAGGILPLKVREIKSTSAGGLIGFN